MAEVERSVDPGRLVHEEVVQPGTGTSGIVNKDQILRIVDVEGQQVADFCSFSAQEPADYCDIIYSTFAKSSWKLSTGDTLVTKRMQPLWTIVADTCGVHYCGGGFCCRDLRRWAGLDARDGCRDTLEAQLAKHGLSPVYLSPSSCFNVFMNMQYKEDGSWPLREPESKPGDHIDLRAETDVLWAVSVCQWPEVCNGDKPTPLKFEVYDPA
jgi:uncharacterized protein YcgI (DUF1989 family)